MTELIISSSVLILVVILLRHFLKSKISLRLQYALWALVLIRLIVPITLFESPISVMNAVERSAAYKAAEQTLLKTQVYSDVIRHSEMTPDEAREAGKGTLHEIQGYPSQSDYGNLRTYIFMDALSVLLAQILRIVWLAGIAVVGLTLLLSNLSFSRKLKKDRIHYQTANCILPVYVLNALPSPCLFGLFRPAIYITSDVANDETKLHHVLAHEQTHFLHGDHIWSALRGLSLAIHWFNPFVWLAAALSRRDSELACDEGTIKRIGEEGRMEYGRTLIGLTCQKRKAMDLLCCATTMTDGKKGIKERITLISKKPRILLPALVLAVLVAAVAVGCTFTGAKNEDEIVPLTAAEVEQRAGDRVETIGDSERYGNEFTAAANELYQKSLEIRTIGQVSTVYTREEELGHTAVRDVAELLMTELLDDLKTEQDGRTFTITDWKTLSVSADRMYDAWVVTGDVEVLYEGILSPIGDSKTVPQGEYVSASLGERYLRNVDGVYTLSISAGEQQAILEPPLLTADMSVGIGVIPDYADDDILIFHGYFGLFVYDLKAEIITFAADLKKAVGTTAIQGSEGAAVRVSADGSTIQLFFYPEQAEPLMTYTIDSRTGSYSYSYYASLDAYFVPTDAMYNGFSFGTLGELTYTYGENSRRLFADWDWAD